MSFFYGLLAAFGAVVGIILLIGLVWGSIQIQRRLGGAATFSSNQARILIGLGLLMVLALMATPFLIQATIARPRLMWSLIGLTVMLAILYWGQLTPQAFASWRKRITAIGIVIVVIGMGYYYLVPKVENAYQSLSTTASGGSGTRGQVVASRLPGSFGEDRFTVPAGQKVSKSIPIGCEGSLVEEDGTTDDYVVYVGDKPVDNTTGTKSNHIFVAGKDGKEVKMIMSWWPKQKK